MGHFDTKENVEDYIQMAEGHDGAILIKILREHLPEGSSILEIGMGPGKDLDTLSKTYAVTGSDHSTVFLDRYRSAHPDADLLHLDAETLETDRSFDCIFSNKVLHQLDREQLARSFLRQRDILTPGGLAIHSFWYGEENEEHEGMTVYNITEDELAAIINRDFEIVEIQRYQEFEEDDSILVLLRKNGAE